MIFNLDEPNRFKIFLIITALVVAGGGVLAWQIYRSSPSTSQQTSNQSVTSGVDENLITKVEVNLTSEQTKQTQANIDKLKQEIKDGATKDGYNWAQAYLQLGQQYETLGDLANARRAYQSAAASNPFISVPWGNLGSLYIKMGNNGLAEQAFNKALQIEPKMIINWAKYLDFYFNQLHANQSKMRELYDQAFLATDNNLDLHHAFANYLLSVDNKADAITQLQFILSKNSKDTAAQQQLKELTGK